MPNIGPMELIIILVIVLVVFGPKRLPGLGRQLGSGMREFKESITSRHSDDDDEDEKTTTGLAAAPEETRAPKQAPASPEPETVTGEARPQDQTATRAD